LEGILEALLPKAPSWLLVPGTIILLLLFAWPSLQEIWRGLIPSYRAYAREKRRLDLLKLYYEIEAIKKDHQLVEVPEIQSEALNALLQQLAKPSIVSDKYHGGGEAPGISTSQRLLFGALGGILVFIVTTFPYLTRDPLS
jgi:hypothetical protein